MARIATPASALFLSILILIGLATSTADAAPTQQPFLSCYMLFGFLDDLGYTHAINLGRIASHRNLQAKYPTRTLQSVAVIGAFFGNQTAITEQLVQKGCNVIHGTSPAFTGSMLTYAAKFPNVTFALQNAWGLTSGPSNLVLYGSRTYNPWYVAGRVAGKSAQAKACFLAAWNNNNEVLNAVGAFARGLQDERPGSGAIEMLPTQSWYDPTRERIGVRALHQHLKCDIIAQFTDSFVAAEYAALPTTQNLFAVQMHGQANTFYGDVVLTCVYSDWTDIYVEVDEAVLLGQAPPRSYIFASSVPKLCDVSPAAPAGAVVYGAGVNINQINAFPQFSDADLRNVTVPDAAQMRVHPAVPDLSAGPSGSTLSITLDKSTGLLQSAFTPCPANTYTADKVSCTPCDAGLVADVGSSACRVPDSSLNTGALAGGLTSAIVVVILCFVAVLVAHRRRMNAMLRDNSSAPLKGPCGIIFTDIEGSTRLWNEDPDGMAEALTKHNDIMRAAIAKFEAYEVKTVGDCFMIATATVEAGVGLITEIQTQMTRAAWREPTVVKVRIGFDFGPLDVNYDETTKGYDYFGPTVNRAARCEQSAGGGHSLVPAGVVTQLNCGAGAPANVRFSEALPMEFHGFEESVAVSEIIIDGVTQLTAWRVVHDSGSDSSVHSTASAHGDQAAKYREEASTADVKGHPLVQRGVVTSTRFVMLRNLVNEVLRQCTVKMRPAEKRDFIGELQERFGLRRTDATDLNSVTNRILQFGRAKELLALAAALNAHPESHSAGSTSANTPSMGRTANTPSMGRTAKRLGCISP